MILYAETNFVLELVLVQEEAPSCEAILQLAEARRIQLALPAYSFIEPHETFHRRHSERDRLAVSAHQQLALLRRSQEFLGDPEGDARVVDRLFVESAVLEERRLDSQRFRLLECARVIPLSPAIIKRSMQLRAELGVSGQDAAVFASILEDLAGHSGTESCFVTKNSKDFGEPDIVKQLAQLGCKSLFSFESALNYTRSRIENRAR